MYIVFIIYYIIYNILLYNNLMYYEVRDNSVDIVTRYGLDGTGFESRWEARFSAPRPDRP